MPWTIERKHDHVAIVTMNTNKVNAQGPAFFDDLHADATLGELGYMCPATCGPHFAGIEGPASAQAGVAFASLQTVEPLAQRNQAGGAKGRNPSRGRAPPIPAAAAT